MMIRVQLRSEECTTDQVCTQGIGNKSMTNYVFMDNLLLWSSGKREGDEEGLKKKQRRTSRRRRKTDRKCGKDKELEKKEDKEMRRRERKI
jgi:hypothetical protein